MRRFITNTKPMDFTHGLKPQSKDDALFFKLRRERPAKKETFK